MKLIFTRKAAHLASFESEGFWKLEVAYSLVACHQYSFLRRHFAVKPLMASRNVSCFLRLRLQYNNKQVCVVWNSRGIGGKGGGGQRSEANNQSLKVTKLLQV